MPLLVERFLLIGRTLVRSLSHETAAKCALTYQQLVALQAVESEDVRNQSGLAERLLIDAAAASRLVDRLSEEGLLKRLAGEDRRCVRLEVTPAGSQLVKLLRVEFENMEAQLERYLTEREVKSLEQLLEKVSAGLKGESTKA